VYTDCILGAPRQLLSLVRRNIPGDEQADWDTDVNLVGHSGMPFVPHQIPPGTAPAAEEYGPQTQGWFDFDADPLSEYQYHFLKKVVELARSHGTALVFLHVPLPEEQGAAVIHERQRTPELLGKGVSIAGIPFRELFREIPANHVDEFYRDDHFNRNGQLLFTQSVVPVLERIYAKETTH
jgi:hypothetical protein